MLGGGNNNLFVGNTFDTLCYEVSDSGAWYTPPELAANVCERGCRYAGRSWIQRGNVIMSNVYG